MPLAQSQIDTLDNISSSIYINRYDGGLNTTDSNEILRDNESIIRKNWGNDNVGALQKVRGYTKMNSSAMGAKPILGLFRVYQSDGTTKLLAVCDTKLFFSDDDGATFTGATSGTGLSATAFNSGVNYNDLFFFSNTTDNLQHYTPGTDTMAAATDQPTDPCGVILKRTDRRLLALVNAVNGSTLYFSKIDPTGAAADDWSAANDAGSIAIDGAKSEPLTGGMTFGATDILFKSYGAFKVWGYPNPQAIHMPGSPGSVSPYSMAQGDGLGFHLSPSKEIWMWDGNKFIKVSDSVKEFLNSINDSFIQNCFGVYRNGFYWFFYTSSGGTTNDKCLIYDVFHSDPYSGRNIWFERPSLPINNPIVFDGPGDGNKLYGGASAATGFVYRLDFSSSGADVTADIEAINQTKYFNADTPHLVKRFKKIHIRYYLSTGSLLINWYTNRGSTSGSFTLAPSQTGTKLGSFTLGTDSLVGPVEITHTEQLPDNAIGKDVSIKITSDASGDAPIIRDMEIEWEGMYFE